MSADAATLTQDQKEAARKAAKAEKEAARREAIKVAQQRLEDAGLPKDTKLTPEQRARAVESAETKKGLGKKALAEFILEGKTSKEQMEEAKATHAQEAKAEKTRSNITRSADPDASALAVAAKELAPDVKSAFLPKDAREFLDKFEVRKSGSDLIVTRSDLSGDDAKVTFPREALETFSIGGQKDAEVRGKLARIGKDSRLWGRKLGLMVLASKS